jgi:hypothetical protein
MWCGLGVLVMAWCGVVIPVVMRIRAHQLDRSDVAIALLAGYLLGFLVDLVWFGVGGRPQSSRRDGQRRISARTLTGVRSVDLEGLATIRRFTMRGRGETDLLLLRDRRGVRLAFEDGELDDLIRRAVERSRAEGGGTPVKVTPFAARRLGLDPAAPEREAGRWALGLARFIALPALYAVLGYLLVRGLV